MEHKDNITVISNDENYRRILDQAKIVAGTDATVLIRGENGCGKEVLANYIHRNSERADKKMVIVNCAAIPEQLIESELFGYEEGTFTGAKKGGKIGKFELADGGTIFLDEIGDMPYSMQAKLLRVLQEGEIEKIGRQKGIPVDVRVIAATNQPLEQLIEEKKFRMDLFYRLNVISLTIPPLAQRKKDIVELTNQFLQTFNQKYHKELSIDGRIMETLLNYNWPGNVRELRNCIESSVIICNKDQITFRDLPQYLQDMKKEEVVNMEVPASPANEIARESDFTIKSDMCKVTDLQIEIRKYEKHLINIMIAYCNGDKALAAKHLNISTRSLYRKMNEAIAPVCMAVTA